MARLVPNIPPPEQSESLSLAQLEQAIHAAEPAAWLVAPRILRRVIKQSARIGGIGLRVPHRKTYVIASEELLTIVNRSEMDLPAGVELTDHVILIARPTPETLSTLRKEEVLIKYWRLLFHTRVHLALARKITEGKLGEREISHRIQEIGEAEFDEIRAVLRQEDYLLPPISDRAIYVEFIAVYLELRYFAPAFLPSYFPALQDLPQIDALIRHDLDGEYLLAATLLEGAPEPTFVADLAGGERALGSDRLDGTQLQRPSRRLPARKRSAETAAALLAKADRVSLVGNLVRAAILRTRAARHASPEESIAAREKARSELGRLARRLQAALSFTDNEADEWTRSLHSLLDHSARGIWTAEARMLYDLQKVCVDHERGIYTLDLFGWIRSFGRGGLKRFLPGQRDVLISKHLRSAAHRLPAAHLSNRARMRLAALLQTAVHRAESNLRARFEPVVERALDKVRLLPRNPPERVARKKLVDEILDRIVDRGFLSMGDLRDALSRNNLKLPDLSGVEQFVMGDQLLRADKQLAASLDGVYRGGEVYLRWPQRLSSLAFGTPAGRFLTRYAALPFGGAFLLLEGLQHLVDPVIHRLTSDMEIHLVGLTRVLSLGLFLLGLLYNRRFRTLCLQGVLAAGRAGRKLFYELPVALLQLPLVQRIVHSKPFRLFARYAFKPLVISALIAPIIATIFDLEVSLKSSLVIFIIINLALNSRIGRNVDEMVTDWVSQLWHRIRIHVFAALFRLIMDVFHRLLESIERLLYTVDEWLRFRAGESRTSTLAKSVLGFLWFFVNYVIRFCVNLLLEPQVNPIKHFPVVTVSHKILLPLIPALVRVLVNPLGPYWAGAIAPTVIFVLPGVVGFLVWELKENWRLYAANRPGNLQPIAIGHHGETMIQFIRPGFRSGTLPKLYAKLRRANRKAYWSHNWKASGKHLDGLHHAGVALRRFVDRELLELLHESRGWDDRSITTGELHLGCNRILVELYCPELSEESLWLAFEDKAGWLVAGVYRRGWSDALSDARRHTLINALAGFYKMAGVDLVREQIDAQLEPGAPGYQIIDETLVIWTKREAAPRVYRLHDWPTLSEPAGDFGRRAEADHERWIFAATPLAWRRWVTAWEIDQFGSTTKHHVLENMHLLPS